ncbi:MAG: HlyD family efflux transporter periplasmic adaptor subunit [Pseudomonadota bacterium]
MALDTTDNSNTVAVALDARPADAERQGSPRRQPAAEAMAALADWSAWLAGLLGPRVSISVFAFAADSPVRLDGAEAQPAVSDAVSRAVTRAHAEGVSVEHRLTGDSATVLAVPARDRRGTPLVIGCVLPGATPAATDTTQRVITHAIHWLDTRDSAVERADGAGLLGRLDRAPNVTHAAQILVDTLASAASEQGAPPRVAYFSRAGAHGLRLRAISAQASPVDTSAWCHSCRRVAREYLYQSAKTVGMLDAPAPAASDGLVRTQHRRHAAEFGCHRVMTVGMPSRAAEGCAVLIAEFPEDGGCADITFRSWSDTVRRCGATLAWHERAARGVSARALRLLSPAFVWHRVRSNALRNALVLAALVGLMAAATVSVPGTVRAHAEVIGAAPRVVGAPRDGYLESVHVRPGDRVSAGQVLAVLNTDDLQAERAKWQAESERINALYHAALASRDRREISVQRARQDEVRAERDAVDTQIARSTLRAQRDGVVARGDLTERLGGAVAVGETLFETVLAGPKRIRLYVRDTDIARLDGAVTGRMVLAAQPGEEHRVVTQLIKPVATTHANDTVFIVEADSDSLPADVLPGMTGYAALDAAEMSLLAAWTLDARRALHLLFWRLGVL